MATAAARNVTSRRTSSKTAHKAKKGFKLSEVGLFVPRTWAFWRTLTVCFFFFSMVGHWLEIPYCTFMDMFGIVEPDYAVWNDPWFVPYWVYGIGAVVMTLILEPLKEKIISHRKTKWGAILETFGITVFISMVLEAGIGLIINQPDEFGVYPFWDNSELPFNILGQAWLVNDIVIGAVAVLYIWVLYPIISKALLRVPNKIANAIFVLTLVLMGAACLFSYVPGLIH